MDDAFRAKLQSKLAGFRSGSAGRTFTDCRLVHYCGVEMVGAQSLKLAQVEPTIEGLFCEGFYVDWAEHLGRLYLRVWEYDGPEPEWSKVFLEESLADIAAILREASQDAEQNAAADTAANCS